MVMLDTHFPVTLFNFNIQSPDCRVIRNAQASFYNPVSMQAAEKGP